MSFLSTTLFGKISSLSLYPFVNLRLISTSAVLWAEPLKKKKKIDPAIIRAREEKKKRRLEKQIRKLQRGERQLKPLDENEVPICLLDNVKERRRNLPKITQEEDDARWRLVKEWSVYRSGQVRRETAYFNRIIDSQNKALEELKNVSPSLYEAAVQIDPDFTPFVANGPTHTPLIPDYQYPNGDYIDISKKWDQQ